MKFARVALPFVALALVATPVFAGPPWISVEFPVNPFDRASRDAFLLVHVFHHQQESGEGLTGRAVGIVLGQKRTVTLSFERTERPGVYALKPTWGDRGEWTLVLTRSQDHGDAAEVMVKVSGARVIGVEAATRKSRFAELSVEPRRFTEAEVSASLDGRGD